jgi:phosphotriesterase-related protein
VGIRTVLGDIAPEALGFCQCHEHLCLGGYPGGDGRGIDEPEKTLAELTAWRNAGGRALVDAQPVGCGRDAAVLAGLAERGAISLIASTGFHRPVYYPPGHWILSAGEAQLTRLFVEELEDGMYLDGDEAFPRRRSRWRAGQIKTALDREGLTEPRRRLFRAATAAALETGRPLMAHVEAGSDPAELADFLEKAGLSPDRIILCHLDRAVPDTAVHRDLCRRGIYLEYDTIGRLKYHDDSRELDIIGELLDAGYGNRLLLSLDTTKARLRSYGGKPGLTHIIEVFIPLMQKTGISGEEIRRFFVENPARVFDRA